MSTVTGPDATSGAAHTKTYTASKKSALGSAQNRPVTIAFAGETGSGKDSFMTLLVDLFLGTEVHELIDLHKASDTTGPGEGQTPTIEVTLHKIKTLDGPLIQLLETSDIGAKDDGSSITKITDAMQNDLRQVDAVIIVADGLTPHWTNKTLTTIAEIFPRTLVDNIALVFPDSDKQSWKFEMNSLLPELRTAEHWLLHNPLGWVKYFWKVKKERPDDTEAVEEIINEVKRHYSNTVKTLDGWLRWVNSRSTRSTYELRQPLEFKIKFKANFEGIESNLDRLKKEKAKLLELQPDDEFRIEYTGSQKELTELENAIKEVKQEIKELERRLGSLRRPTEVLPGVLLDIDADQRSGIEEKIRKKKSTLTYLEDQVLPSLYRAVRANRDIDTYIRIIIFRELNEFHEKSFRQKFTSDINDVIQILEDRKVTWEPRTEYEVERKAIDDISQMLTEKLRNTSE